MKKIFTLAIAALACFSSFAIVQTENKISDLQIDQQKLAMHQQKVLESAMAGTISDAAYTRTWDDGKGNIWTFQLVFNGETILDYLVPEAVSAWENQFFYLPSATLVRKKANSDENTDGAVLSLQWPTMYWYEQLYTYDGELTPDNTIPNDKRDTSIVPPSELFNNPDRCRKFTEAPYIGCDITNEGINTWFMLGGGTLSNFGAGLFNGKSCVTYYDVDVTADDELVINDASVFNFSSYEEEDSNAEFNFKLVFGTKNEDTGALSKIGQINGDYTGDCYITGFEPTYVNAVMNEIHLFNVGEYSSDILEDDNPFTEDFDPVTQFYMLAIPAEAQTEIGEGEFAENKVKYGFPEDGPSNKVNFMRGYLYGDIEYAEDIESDPVDQYFGVKEYKIVWDELLEQYYASIYPEPGTFVSGGYNVEWSQSAGMRAVSQGYWQVPLIPNSRLQWGTNEGFVANLYTDTQWFITFTSTNDIIYHYDPKDISKTRNINVMGENPPIDAVESVVAEGAAKIFAAEGVINVVAAEKAHIAIFSLDGKLVKAANAETLSVEAAKGVYVVRVANEVKKVIL